MLQRLFGSFFDCINGTTKYGYFEDISQARNVTFPSLNAL